jgi:YHS domain-containing protein
MVFSWLIRFLVVMLLVRLVWKFLSGVVAGAARRPQVAPKQAVALVRDPECGTFIDRDRAMTLRRKGELHYFCSEDCRTAFQHKQSARARGA